MYQAQYAVAYPVDPEASQSTVISGAAAISQIESAHSTKAWSGSGAYVYDLLANGGKAVYVEISGAPDYILVPFPSGFALDHAAVYELVATSCNDAELRIGKTEDAANWCLCLIGCPPHSCPSCSSGADEWNVSYTNDAEQFADYDPSDELDLWD